MWDGWVLAGKDLEWVRQGFGNQLGRVQGFIGKVLRWDQLLILANRALRDSILLKITFY